jgi:hypothetical protein
MRVSVIHTSTPTLWNHTNVLRGQSSDFCRPAGAVGIIDERDFLTPRTERHRRPAGAVGIIDACDFLTPGTRPERLNRHYPPGRQESGPAEAPPPWRGFHRPAGASSHMAENGI